MYYCADENNIYETIRKDKNYVFIKGNLCDNELISQLLTKYQITHVIHFAAQSHVQNSFEDSIKFTYDNILGTHTLLECCRKYNGIKKIIHVSTDEVYGESMNSIDEKHKTEHSVLCPTNPYAATKAGAELIAQSYNHSYRMPIIITRGNNVYGQNQYPEKLIPSSIFRLLKNKPIEMETVERIIVNTVSISYPGLEQSINIELINIMYLTDETFRNDICAALKRQDERKPEDPVFLVILKLGRNHYSTLHIPRGTSAKHLELQTEAALFKTQKDENTRLAKEQRAKEAEKPKQKPVVEPRTVSSRTKITPANRGTAPVPITATGNVDIRPVDIPVIATPVVLPAPPPHATTAPTTAPIKRKYLTNIEKAEKAKAEAEAKKRKLDDIPLPLLGRGKRCRYERMR
jgi:nucleoside-diphosphate-sugar epimerase